MLTTQCVISVKIKSSSKHGKGVPGVEETIKILCHGILECKMKSRRMYSCFGFYG